MKQLLTKYQIFMILPQISFFHHYPNFSGIFATFLDQLLHPYKFYGRDTSGILFFIFASCEPLMLLCNEEIYLIVSVNLTLHLVGSIVFPFSHISTSH